MYMSWILVVVLLLCGAWSGDMTKNVHASTSDGVYSVPVSLWSASVDSLSMGNDSMQQTGKLVVADGKTTLYVKFKQMVFSGMTGYMSAFDLLKDISYNAFHYPEQYTLQPGNIVSTYDDVDQFNGADSTDVNCAGKLYPKVISVPIDWEDNNIWAHVYVPVMGSLGFGDQICRIHMDWDSVKSMSESEKERWALDENATATATPEATDGASGETQTPKPENSPVKTTEPTTDKTVLYEWIAKANALVTQTTVYAEASLINLQSVLTNAQKAYDSNTTQTVVDAQIKLLSEAIDGLVKISSEELDKDNLADGKYYVYVYLWHATSDKASMGNPALNHKALLTVENGVYNLTMSAHPITVGTITACLQSIQIKQSDGSYQYATITERKNTNNQPSVFSFNLPTKEEYTSVLIDPKVAVMGTEPLPARLKINWNTLTTAEANATVDSNTSTSTTSNDDTSKKSTSKKSTSSSSNSSDSSSQNSSITSSSDDDETDDSESSVDENTIALTESGSNDAAAGNVANNQDTIADTNMQTAQNVKAMQILQKQQTQRILYFMMLGISIAVSVILMVVTMVLMVQRKARKKDKTV